MKDETESLNLACHNITDEEIPVLAAWTKF